MDTKLFIVSPKIPKTDNRFGFNANVNRSQQNQRLDRSWRSFRIKDYVTELEFGTVQL